TQQRMEKKKKHRISAQQKKAHIEIAQFDARLQLLQPTLALLEEPVEKSTRPLNNTVPRRKQCLLVYLLSLRGKIRLLLLSVLSLGCGYGHGQSVPLVPLRPRLGDDQQLPLVLVLREQGVHLGSRGSYCVRAVNG
ncbi:hypothetical protein PFISCL1PPCAC_3021, partial [Pristionchus fissidentatus]